MTWLTLQSPKTQNPKPTTNGKSRLKRGPKGLSQKIFRQKLQKTTNYLDSKILFKIPKQKSVQNPKNENPTKRPKNPPKVPMKDKVS